jgi:hypothetical protein
MHDQLLPPNGGNRVAEDCSFHRPFKDGGPFAPLVSAKPLEAAPAHGVVYAIKN